MVRSVPLLFPELVASPDLGLRPLVRQSEWIAYRSGRSDGSLNWNKSEATDFFTKTSGLHLNLTQTMSSSSAASAHSPLGIVALSWRLGFAAVFEFACVVYHCPTTVQ